ncbi:MAG TPA: RDD family protein [Thermoanaerobaculia bacterium]|nr:RDD family protein [Thermoanaerobaculia bacterium]
MQRFDEVELEPVPLIEEAPVVAGTPARPHDAPRFRRLLALLTDLSLFVALTLALSPLLPLTKNVIAVAALGGFIVMTSYYYFVGTWLLWGKTIGGAIFDVRVVVDANSAMSLNAATLRWLGCSVSLLTGGLGFLLAVLPSRRSLADRLSGTRCIAAV